MTSRPDVADVVVVGGGLSGLAVAHACAAKGLETLHLAPRTVPDRRTSALMAPSVQFLRQAGLVTDPSALGEPLTAIRIIDATDRLIRAPETLFEAREAGLEAFAWNFANTALADAFRGAAKGSANLQTIDDSFVGLTPAGDAFEIALKTGNALKARLVVGADGKKSPVRQASGIPVRERPFKQSALVCDLDLGRPLQGESVEFHYPNGPFTLVPAGGNRANLVWIDDSGVLEEARSKNSETLARIFYEKSRHLFGHIKLSTGAVVFALSNLSADTTARDGVVLVGESAHAFPPIGAQGLNLGLRDVADLVTAIDAQPAGAPDWAQKVAVDYAGRRQGDLSRTSLFVDTLYRSLVSSLLPAQAVRAGGLWALRTIPPLRRQAFSLGMGQGHSISE